MCAMCQCVQQRIYTYIFTYTHSHPVIPMYINIPANVLCGEVDTVDSASQCWKVSLQMRVYSRPPLVGRHEHSTGVAAGSHSTVQSPLQRLSEAQEGTVQLLNQPLLSGEGPKSVGPLDSLRTGRRTNWCDRGREGAGPGLHLLGEDRTGEYGTNADHFAFLFI